MLSLQRLVDAALHRRRVSYRRSQVAALLLAAVFAASVAMVAQVSADDTEIFFAEEMEPGETAATVVFMVDTSGSMARFDSTSLSRLSRLKSAMISLVESSRNVKIGIGSFGTSRGSIQLPAVGVDDDLCVNAACDSIKIRGEIRSDRDDAQGFADGTVNLNSAGLVMDGNANTWGLRFDNLNIPRGARINSASLQVIANGWNLGNTTLTITGEAADDSATFSGVNNELTQRSSPGVATASEVAWRTGNWSPWAAQIDYQSPDLSALVREITDRDGWCGGNALTLIVRGSGVRRTTHSHESDAYQAPVLQIDYDPSSVDWSDSCRSANTTSTIASGIDDVSEDMTDGSVIADANLLRTHIGAAGQTIGLRFSSVSIPPGADISEAYVSLNLDSAIRGGVDLRIEAEDSPDSAGFDPRTANTLSGRTFIANHVDWLNVPEDGTLIRSPDITELVSSVVSRRGWTENNAMTFALTPDASSTGQRFFTAVDAPSGNAARLVIRYRQEGTEPDEPPPVLLTGRDEMIRTIMDYEHVGGTPLVDAYFEATQFMRGASVIHGDQPESGNYPEPAFGECNANQIVLLSDGEANGNTSKGRIRSLTGSACARRLNNTEDCAIELAAWMLETDHDDTTAGIQAVKTNTIGFNNSASILSAMAEAGGGSYYEASSASELTSVFTNIVQQAITDDVSFVAPSSAMSLNNRLVNDNALYFAMFKPSTYTIWDGNVKRYELAVNAETGNIEVRDSLSALATNPDGTIKDTAKSFWSTDTDGGSVARGGAASRLTINRDIYTSLYDADAAATVLQPFDESNAAIDLELLNIPARSDAYRTTLLQWARGVDVKDYDGDSNVSEARTQLGDPLHSSPYLMYYAGEQTAEGNPRTLLFFGTNQGFLHAIDTETGNEKFAFIPDELLSNLDYFYRNDPARHDERPYGLDGGISGWHDDVNGNGLIDDDEKAYIYAGMRRGGKNYYALDVSDPDNPEFAWEIEGGKGDFAELAQSWSRPVKAKVNYLGVDRDVLFFAAGYDDSNDDEAERNPDSTGRGFFMVDANNGRLLSRRDYSDFSAMQYSIPSDLRIIDPDGDGYANAIFVGDTGGQLWRFDINNTATQDDAFISGYVIADVSDQGAENNRQFFYEPDVALILNPDGGTFLNIGIGSGSRPNPNSRVVENGFYAFRDSNLFAPPRDADQMISYPDTLTENDLVDVTETSGSSDVSGNLANGWFFRLPSTGEKSLSPALTVDNELMFTTYVPAGASDDVCSARIGDGRLYTLNVGNGDPAGDTSSLRNRYVELEQPGIPPRVVGLIVEAAPDRVSKLVGTEAIPDDRQGEKFKRIFWAEE